MFQKLVIMLTIITKIIRQLYAGVIMMNQTSINDNKISITNPIILYYCGREQCKPSHTFGPAIRPHYLFHYILQGKGKYYVNGSTYKLKAGEGFLITPGVTTVYSADKISPGNIVGLALMDMM